MPPAVAIVADDLTGAADTGAGFLGRARSVLVSWVDGRAWTSAGADVVAIDTNSRAMDVDGARAVTAATVAACRDAGVRTLYKKIDSTFRGHIGDEVLETLAAWDPASVAVVAPAFPATGRTTVGGRLVIQGAGPGAAIDALFDRVDLLSARFDLDVVRSPALPAALRAKARAPAHCLVCDAETDEDLRAIAIAGATLGSRAVWVGSGGLAHAIARASLAPTVVDEGSSRPTSGPVLIVVGSQSAVARLQIADAIADGLRHVAMPVDRLRHAPRGAAVEAARIADILRGGHDVLVTIGAGTSDAAPDAALATRLGESLAPCAALVGAVVLTGGDTAVGVLRSWGITGLRLEREIEDGVVRSTSLGAHTLPVVTKSGSFGHRRSLCTIRARLRGAPLHQ